MTLGDYFSAAGAEASRQHSAHIAQIILGGLGLQPR